MSNIDKFSKEALREVAEDAQKAHKWEGLEKGLKADGYVSTTVRFIQRASPQTVLALLDELEEKDRRIAELEISTMALRG
ncbi:TPA: ead/Ea22-like family protein [Enterobacter cloacae]|nr:ead/Ea22-like family protein [Enterobacter cloacae]